MEDILKKIESRIEPIAEEMQLAIYDVLYIKEGGYNYLQVFIDHKFRKPTLDDCYNFSSQISDIVDEYIQDKYFLEVSTPGIDKRLRKVEHFVSCINEDVTIKTISNIELKKKFEGKLKSVSDNKIKIFDNSLQKDVDIDINKIKEARLKVVIEMEEEWKKVMPKPF